MFEKLLYIYIICTTYIYDFFNGKSIQMIASSTNQNHTHIETLLRTLDDNINDDQTGETCAELVPFTAVQLYNKHVGVVDFLTLCQTMCEEEIPEAVTIITVKQCYSHESVDKTDLMSSVLSVIKKYFTKGNGSDVFTNPLMVSIHVVKKDALEAYDINSQNEDALRVMFKHFNALTIDYILETTSSALLQVLTAKVRDTMIRTISKYFLTKEKAMYIDKCEISEYFEHFENRMLEEITQNRIKSLLTNNASRLSENNKHLDDLCNKFEDCLKEYNEEVKEVFNNKCFFEDLAASKCHLVYAWIAKEVVSRVRSIISAWKQNPDICTAFEGAFTASVTAVVTAIVNNSADHASIQKYRNFYDFIDSYISANYADSLYGKLFGSLDMKEFTPKEFARIEPITKMRQNNDLHTANSTKIILNKELTTENFPLLCQALKNLSLHERIDENRIIYLNIGTAKKDLMREGVIYTCLQQKLKTLIDSSSSANTKSRYEFCITCSVRDYDNIFVTTKKICTKYDTDGKIKSDQITESIDKQKYQDKPYTSIGVYTMNDYQKKLNADITIFIDKCILKLYREIVKIYKISNCKDVGEVGCNEVYAVYWHEKGRPSDFKISFECAFGCEDAERCYNPLANNSRRFKYFHYVSNLYLKNMNLQIQLSQSVPVNLVPYYFTSDSAEFYYTEKTTKYQNSHRISNIYYNILQAYGTVNDHIQCSKFSVGRYLQYRDKESYFDGLEFIKGGYSIANREELQYIVEKLICRKSLMYLMTNNLHAYEKLLYCHDIYIFNINLNDNTSIVHFYARGVTKKLLHYFLNSSIEVLPDLLHGNELETVVNHIKTIITFTDLHMQKIKLFIDRIVYGQLNDNPSVSPFKRDDYTEAMMKMIKKLIWPNQDAESASASDSESTSEDSSSVETATRERAPSLVPSGENFATVQAFASCFDDEFERSIRNLTEKILQKIGEILDGDPAVLTTVLVNRKKTGQKVGGKKYDSMDYDSLDKFELLENHSNLFLSAVELLQ